MRAAFFFRLIELARFLLRTRLGRYGIGVDVGPFQVFLDVLLVVAGRFVAALAHLLVALPGGGLRLEITGPGLLLVWIAVALRLLLQDTRHRLVIGRHGTLLWLGHRGLVIAGRPRPCCRPSCDRRVGAGLHDCPTLAAPPTFPCRARRSRCAGS